MTFPELQAEIGKNIYTEDNGMTRIALASIVATRLQISDPIWLILIGPSSSGKSQVLRPLALTDTKFIHRVDDLTENTLLSGVRTKKGEKDISLLKRIGRLGIIVISDLTVIFSKGIEARAAILGQLRMVYDGEMTKFSGLSSEPITWNGSIGILAGSTPSIYTHFEEVADMGERFIYYRMKNYDIEKATRRSLSREAYGKGLDEQISWLYRDYIKEAIVGIGEEKVPNVSLAVNDRIVYISMFAAMLRTPTHYDKYQKTIDRVPVPEMPMRVAIQLTALARGLMVLRHHDSPEGERSWELAEEDIGYIEWCAYSLANEERRACLKILAGIPFGASVSGQTIADTVGLSTSIISMNLQHLAAIGILDRSADGGSLKWSFRKKAEWEIVRRLEKIEDDVSIIERDLALEESEEMERSVNEAFDRHESSK